MVFLFSVFFGAGVAGWTYSKMGQRTGYSNTQSLWTITGVAFVLSTGFFYTLSKFIIGI